MFLFQPSLKGQPLGVQPRKSIAQKDQVEMVRQSEKCFHAGATSFNYLSLFFFFWYYSHYTLFYLHQASGYTQHCSCAPPKVISREAHEYLTGWVTGTLRRTPRPEHYSFLNHDLWQRANLHVVVPAQFRQGAPPRPVAVLQRDGEPVPRADVSREDQESVQF